MAKVSSRVQAVLLTGGLASGKTAVGVEMGEALERAGQSYAVVDLDWLCWAWSPALGEGGVHDLLCDNLRAILPNLLERGLRHLVLTRGVLSTQGMSQLREATAPVPLQVVRLRCSDEETLRRLRVRDSGALLDAHLQRRERFAQQVAEAAPEAAVVDTTGRQASAVAADILELLDWRPER